MLARLLLDPAAETAGSAPEKADAGNVSTPPAPDPNKVVLNKSDLDAIKAELETFRTKEADAARQAREAEEAKAREKGDYEKLLKNKDSDIAAAHKRADQTDAENRRILDTAARASATRDLMAALPGNLADDDAKAQLLSLLGPHVEAKLDGDNFTTKARDGRSLADFVKAELAKPGYAKFLAANTKGGTGANGSTAAPTKQDGDEPATLGHMMARMNNGGARPGRGNSFGLGPKPAASRN